jgi:NADH:ubiquinone oxidoreductase subunit F (NADH-binding)
MEKKGAQRHRVLELLEHAGDLSADTLRRVSRETGVPEADVFGAARFYDLLVRPGPRVCQGLSCQIRGAAELAEQLEASGIKAHSVSCIGQCDRAPAALDAERYVSHAGPRGQVLPDDPELPMNLGGPDRRDNARLARAEALGPEAVIAAIAEAGLQGRGGAGFPAHIKWAAVRRASGAPAVVCNADEAEPGTFKDRELLLRRPHLLLEGLAIAAQAVGARQAWIYIRGEFREAADRVRTALAEARLGDLDVAIVEGHGAYICGEETALLESIEGRRGMPRLKPPFPTEHGLFGRPTLIHNVETLCCLPAIVERGGAWFRGLGRSEAGTKLYCVSGHVGAPGVYELPLGVTLDELVKVAGGYEGKPLAFSPGGASSGYLPMRYRDTPLDFASLSKIGSMLGSAGVVVLNDTVDMAEAARAQAVFFEDETCGQCAPCRIGTRYVRQAMDRYLQSGDPSALAQIADVGWEMEEGSICGLGMVAAWPITSAMRHFPEDFTERAPDRRQDP